MSIFDFEFRKVVNFIKLKTTHTLPINLEPEKSLVVENNSEDTLKLDISGLYEYFDNWSDKDLVEPYRQKFYKHKKTGILLPYKGIPGLVPYEKRTHICMHITAIEYGTASYQRSPWLKVAKQNPDFVVRLLNLKSISEVNDLMVKKFSEKMALYARFWEVPYHWVSLICGDILYNNDIQRYTYHGDGSNSFSIGVSLEANMPALEKNRKSSHTKITERFILNGRRTLINAVEHARNNDCPLENILPHRCYSPDRVADPGELVWKEIVLPVAKELKLKIDYKFKKDGGLYVPREWDENALYDFRGNLIK